MTFNDVIFLYERCQPFFTIFVILTGSAGFAMRKNKGHIELGGILNHDTGLQERNNGQYGDGVKR